MKPRFSAFACPLALGLATIAAPAIGEDLMQIYREALRADPVIASAQANWVATQEKAPQARSGLLPNVAATGNGSLFNYDATIKGDQRRTSTEFHSTPDGLGDADDFRTKLAFKTRPQVSQADFVSAHAADYISAPSRTSKFVQFNIGRREPEESGRGAA